MYLIWLVHNAGRCAETLSQFYQKLAWSIEALQMGIHPLKHWDGTKSRHPMAFVFIFKFMHVAFGRLSDIDRAIEGHKYRPI